MAKIKLIDSNLMEVMISRLAAEVIEVHGNELNECVLVGVQPKGPVFAKRIQAAIKNFSDIELPLGYIDPTFHRDDFRRRDSPLKANETHIPFLLEEKKVILIDDVLYTGRTIRASLSAMIAFGRPKVVELLTLIDRKYSRDLPVQADYVGKSVNTIQSQRVKVEWTSAEHSEDNVWLINHHQ